MIDKTKKRCSWCLKDPIYVKYHDEEWGVPVHDDKKHFEFLVLESAQAGLNWLTILKRREGYKLVYDGFDPIKVANYDEKKIEKMMKYDGIIRNRRKIESSIKNAKVFLQIQNEYGSFDKYIWSYTGQKLIINTYKELKDVPAKTELSEKISKDLKKRGCSFLGPTIIYSFLQAVGIINDHVVDCFRYKELNKF